MMMTIVCVTRAEKYAWPFLQDLERVSRRFHCQLVIGADGPDATNELVHGPVDCRIVSVRSRGYIESVLDEVLSQCDGDYILRLDDDEKISPAMEKWLADGMFLEHDHWKFPRVHFWRDVNTIILTPHLFPDHQTRLSIRQKAGGRSAVHAGSPWGGGYEAPVCIEHHKFLVKSYEERLAIAQGYDRFQPGYGTGGMLPFSLPEDAYQHEVDVIAYTDGAIPWAPKQHETLLLRRAS